MLFLVLVYICLPTYITLIGYLCYKVIFTIEFNENYESLLDKLHEWGIGDRVGSTVSVMNCLVSKTFRRETEFDLPQENDDV